MKISKRCTAPVGSVKIYLLCGRVAELVYAYVSEAYPVRVESSSLFTPTQYVNMQNMQFESPHAHSYKCELVITSRLVWVAIFQR